jgi:hypothetical protein
MFGGLCNAIDQPGMDKARCPHAVLANAGPPSVLRRGLGQWKKTQCNNNNAEKIHSPQPQPNGRDPASTPDRLPGTSMLNKQNASAINA